MKVLWITKYHSEKFTGGTRVSFNYINALKKIANVQVISLVDIDNNKKSYFQFFKLLIRSRKEIFDFIFFDDHFCVLSILFSNTSNNKILFYHGNWPNLLWTNIKFFCKGFFLYPCFLIGMKKVDITVFVNPWFQEKFKNKVRNALTLLNPVDISKKESFGKSLFENQSIANRKVVLVGNIDARKYKNLILYINWSNSSKKVSNVNWFIYGNVSDKSIANMLEQLGVKLMGFVEIVPYKAFDLHISLSKAENLPLSLFEAAMHSIPCIYPKQDYYKFLEDKKGLLFYKNFDELYKFIELESFEPVDNSFIPKSYSDNIYKLIEFQKKNKPNIKYG